MTFLYQIERKQAALIAAREKQTPKAAPRTAVPAERTVAKRAVARPRTKGQSATMGLPIDSVLNGGVLRLIKHGTCSSKQEALYNAIKGWLFCADTLQQKDLLSTEKVELVGKTVTVGVKLDAELNADLTDFCKRYKRSKREVAYSALRWYIHTRGE